MPLTEISYVPARGIANTPPAGGPEHICNEGTSKPLEYRQSGIYCMFLFRVYKCLLSGSSLLLAAHTCQKHFHLYPLDGGGNINVWSFGEENYHASNFCTKVCMIFELNDRGIASFWRP